MRMILLFAIVCSVSILLMGCGAGNDTSDDKPPDAHIAIDGQQYETKLGSYCWDYKSGLGEGQTKCADTEDPVGLMEDESPITVEANEMVAFELDGNLSISQGQLIQYNEDGDQTEVDVTDHEFTAPDEKGIYIFGYHVEMSKGDSTYAFALDVQ